MNWKKKFEKKHVNIIDLTWSEAVRQQSWQNGAVLPPDVLSEHED